MVLSSSETAKAKKESFPSQVIKIQMAILLYVPFKVIRLLFVIGDARDTTMFVMLCGAFWQGTVKVKDKM